jgi:hypothetical protein
MVTAYGDPKRGLITIFLVQHAGFAGEGAKSLGAFQKAANAPLCARNSTCTEQFRTLN